MSRELNMTGIGFNMTMTNYQAGDR